MIEVKKLNKHFKKHHVLKDIDLEISKPGIYSILGPNGSGKTTLMKSILGLVIPQSGEIIVNNQSVLGGYEYRKNISYLPQIARFPDNLLVREIIKMVKDIRQQPADENRIIDLFNLHKELDKKIGTLSGGNKQKVNMVLAFMFDSPIIILDEPTTGLDPVATTKFKRLIEQEKAKGKYIIYTTHIMSLVEELSDEIIFILDGKIHYKGIIDDLRPEKEGFKLENAIAEIIENY